MRSAQVIGCVDVSDLVSALNMGEYTKNPAAGSVEIYDCPAFVERWFGRLLSGLTSCRKRFSVAQTAWIGPHTDEVIGDVTVGVILAGSHELYTGNGRYAGDLVTGSVYVLQNKRTHGARQKKCSEGADNVLVFAAVDLVAEYADVVKHLTRCAASQQLQAARAMPGGRSHP